MNKYNLDRLNYPSKIHDWRNLHKNYATIALNVFYAKKASNIFCLCFKTLFKSWKTSSVFNDFKQRKIALSWSKRVYNVFKRSHIKRPRWFSLSEFHSFLYNKLNLTLIKKHENQDFCNFIMPSENNKISEYNQY